MLSVYLLQLHLELGIPENYPNDPPKPLFVEATSLVEAGPDVFGRSLRLTPAAAKAWRDLQAAARRDGIELFSVSGFRSYHYQAGLIRRKLDAGQNLQQILRTIAAPGFSEHHSGQAVDITTTEAHPLEEIFETTAAFQWLLQHAHQYGFYLSYPKDNPYGFIYEPWHWAYRGTAVTHTTTE